MLVAGEISGDALGAELMAAMKEMSPFPLAFSGVGGENMEREGLSSIFPMTDIAVMGPREIVPRLPLIFRRIWQTVRHAVDVKPDIVVVIDSPEFTHMVAKRIARRAPSIPIVDYVLPSVWAWRQGRAKAMKKYIRRVLALLPFEPAFLRSAGVDCVYVGHPAIHRIPIGIFGDVVKQLACEIPNLRVVLPVVPHVRELAERAAASWPVDVLIVKDESEKRAAFGAATAAMAASGTVALELGLARVPMVIAYRAEALVGWIALSVLKIPSVVLVNLILDRPAVREYLQSRCTAADLLDGLRPLMSDTPERRRALADLDELRACIGVDGALPSRRAAQAVLELL